MNQVCAVIVTYNRSELLCRCVEHLLAQDYPLDVMIYDNHSTQDVKGLLQSKNLLKSNVNYFYADSNTGGSGGFYYGMKMAVKHGYKYLWLMDDDGYALTENTLSNLMEDAEKLNCEDFIINSLVVCDEEATTASFNLGHDNDVKIIKEKSLNGFYEGEIMPFNGTLIPSSFVQKIGYPMKDFFVYGDENEYFLRAQRANGRLCTDTNSLYYHPTNLQDKKVVFGYTFYVGSMPQWKSFCAARNKMYIAKKYYGLKGVVSNIVHSLIYIAVIPGNRIERIKTSFTGWHDGLKGDFSRKLDFSK